MFGCVNEKKTTTDGPYYTIRYNKGIILTYTGKSSEKPVCQKCHVSHCIHFLGLNEGSKI